MLPNFTKLIRKNFPIDVILTYNQFIYFIIICLVDMLKNLSKLCVFPHYMYDFSCATSYIIPAVQLKLVAAGAIGPLNPKTNV